MDFTWPMSGSHNADDREERGQRDESTAVDFVVNAWSLLRGLGSEKKTVAAASLAAAGEQPSGERNVDFVKQTWALYQQAMDEGWVTEWVERFCTPDIFLTDCVGRSTPYIIHGHDELCEYYNVVLEKVWDHGKATVTWVPRGFYSMGSIVIAEYDIEVAPKGNSHTRQLWMYHVEGDKLSEIRMYPLAGKSPGVPPPVRPPRMPQRPQKTETARQRTEAEEMHAMNDTASCVSMPSLAESIPQHRPGGVALTRPCSHNAWDNVRIKRGWAILRCRICQCQWRLRPTAIPHCADFARGAGVCPRGVECSLLHVHRTREQSSEAKKLAASVTSTPTLAPNVGSAPPPMYMQHDHGSNNSVYSPYAYHMPNHIMYATSPSPGGFQPPGGYSNNNNNSNNSNSNNPPYKVHQPYCDPAPLPDSAYDDYSGFGPGKAQAHEAPEPFPGHPVKEPPAAAAIHDGPALGRPLEEVM